MSAAARRAAEALSRHRVLLPAGRHRHADPELRPAGGDRRAVHRQRPRRPTRRSPAELVKSIRQDPRRGRCARAPAPGRAGRQPADGPHAAAADRPVGAQRRPERADLAVGQLADGARVLAQSAERRGLQHRGADAAVPASTRSTRCSTCRSPRSGARPPAHGTTQLLGNLVEARRGAPAGGRLALQHHCRRSTSTSACRAPTSRASPAQVQKLVDEIRPEAAARQPDRRCAARCETMQASFIGLGVGLAMAIVLGLPADRRQLPVVDRRRDHHRRRCRRRSPASPGCCSSPARRCRVPALTGAIMTMGVATGQQHPARLVRAPARSWRRVAGAVGRARGRRDAHPAGADDGAGDDHRHDPDGARHRRRRRAERAARPRRDRRPAVRDRVDAAVRAGRLRRRAPAPARVAVARIARARTARAAPMLQEA